MKNNWKHLNFENRKVIRSGIANHRFLFERKFDTCEISKHTLSIGNA